MRNKLNIRDITGIAAFIAMQIVLTRFFSIQTLTLRIGFAFIPLAFCSMLYGPINGGIAAAIADVVGIFLFPTAPFFPGFTLTAFLSGMVYGVFLHKKRKTVTRFFLSAAIVCIVLNLGMDTLWLMMITGKGFLIMLPTRLIKALVMIPVQVIMLKLLQEYVMERLFVKQRRS